MVNVTGISFIGTSVSMDCNSHKQITYTITPSDATNKNIIWTSSNPVVATVDSTGKVNTWDGGRAIITATTEDGNYTATLNVSSFKYMTSISLNKSYADMYIGETETLIPTLVPSDAYPNTLNWTTSNSLIATVSPTGIVTAINSGTAIITAQEVDGTHKATCTVNIITHANGITLNKYSNWNYENKTIVFYGNVTPSSAFNKNITVTSSNTDSIIVESITYNPVEYPNYTFKISLNNIDPGVSNVTVTTEDKEFVATYVATTYENLENINIVEDNVNIGIGSTLKLTINNGGIPINMSVYVFDWISSNSNAVTINDEGVITGVGMGTATITAISGPYVNDEGIEHHYSDTCVVTVYNAVTNISLNKLSTILYMGETETLIATVTPTTATNKNVTWTSSNTNIATVDNNGKITTVMSGTTIITATTEDGNYTATCEVTILIHTQSISLNKTTLDLYINTSETLIATILPTNSSNKNMIWTTSNSAIATVSNTGDVVGINTGTCNIKVQSQDGNYFATCFVTVKQHVTGISLNKSSTIIQKLNSETLIATVTPTTATNKNVTWTSSNTNIATVDNNGIVFGVNSGNTIITATTEDGNYTANCNVKINTAPTTLITTTAGKTISNNQTITVYDLIDFNFNLKYFDNEGDVGSYIVKINNSEIINKKNVANNSVDNITISKSISTNDNIIEIYITDPNDSNVTNVLSNYFILKYVIIDDISIQDMFDDYGVTGNQSISGLSIALNAEDKLSFKEILDYLQS